MRVPFARRPPPDASGSESRERATSQRLGPTSTAPSALSSERIVVAVSLLLLAALAWTYLWMQAQPDATSTPMMAMPGMAEADTRPTALIVIFLMWSVMMVGMMLPSVLPTVLLYARLVQTNRAAGTALPSAWMFTAGYLALWLTFAVIATVLQALLEASGLLSPLVSPPDRRLAGVLFLLAGIYQWLPMKSACLDRCRVPLQTLLSRWHSGVPGAFRMGADHGLICVGCCWALMLLMFAGGAMNLLWMALIAGFILIEKLFPNGKQIGRMTGIVACAAGMTLILVGL